MRSVVMAGGKGVRLQPYTRVLPKPMLPLGDHPILAWLISALAAAGVTEVTLAVHHMAYVFRSYFGDGRRFGVRVRYVQETEPLGTAGPLRLIPDHGEPLLVTNADIVTTLDFADLFRFHRERDSWLTVATQLRVERSKLGVLQTDGERVLSYLEKPARSDLIGIGVYVVEPRALAYLPPDGPCDMPDLVRFLLADQRPVFQYQTEAAWHDLGSPEDYEDVLSRWTELEASMRGRPP